MTRFGGRWSQGSSKIYDDKNAHFSCESPIAPTGVRVQEVKNFSVTGLWLLAALWSCSVKLYTPMQWGMGGVELPYAPLVIPSEKWFKHGMNPDG
jgi:hypothetical protein